MILDRSKDSKPLYLQIKDILKHKIITSEYPVGSTIPSENELEDMFSVSRMTIRQAVNELVNEGLLKKKEVAEKEQLSFQTQLLINYLLLKVLPKKCLNRD